MTRDLDAAGRPINSLFQARHMEAIAKLIGDIPEGDLRVVTAIRFAALFQKDNPKFKHDKFMKACRVVAIEEPGFPSVPGIGKSATI